MTTLTSEQKAAGREFRSRWLEVHAGLDREFPCSTMKCSALLAWYRHECPGRGSQALYLHQNYVPSPDGLFIFYWRQGKCAKCGFSVRTEPDFDLAVSCPPEKGAVLHSLVPMKGAVSHA